MNTIKPIIYSYSPNDMASTAGGEQIISAITMHIRELTRQGMTFSITLHIAHDADTLRRIMTTGEGNGWLELYEEQIRDAAQRGETSVVVSYAFNPAADRAIEILRGRGFEVYSCDAYDNKEISWKADDVHGQET